MIFRGLLTRQDTCGRSLCYEQRVQFLRPVTFFKCDYSYYIQKQQTKLPTQQAPAQPYSSDKQLVGSSQWSLNIFHPRLQPFRLQLPKSLYFVHV